jgi:hypothetical protein
LEPKGHKNEKLGEWALVEAHLPGLPPQNIGVLVRDVSDNRLCIRLRPQWWLGKVDEEESEIWSELFEGLAEDAQRLGADQVLEWLEKSASHAIRVSSRQEVRLTQAEVAAASLYGQHVDGLDKPLELAQRKRKQTVAFLRTAEKRIDFVKRLAKPAAFRAGMAAATAAVLLLLIQPVRYKPPIAHVTLSAYRDAQSTLIPEGTPVRMTLGPVNVTDGPVGAQVLDSFGYEVWRGGSAVLGEYVEIALPPIEGRGMHLLRLYRPSGREKNIDVLEEFSFLVGNENGSQ